MRLLSVAARRALLVLPLVVAPAFASEPAEGGPVNLLEPKGGLMFWTLLVFIVLLFVLSRYAFKPLFAAVEAREKALEDAIAGANRDREEAQRLLSEQKAGLEHSRVEAQKIIADARSTAEKMKADLLEQTRQQQVEMLEGARRDIEGEKSKAIADLRREAVDLAIAGAGKVIQQNLDAAGNRKIVETFLASIDGAALRKR
ncbi:MAG: F0F1 ATP synthase subunit B [Gemmatimonadaceae bacterium]|nr:F0F1 ATP synthase subunit B [Gemmatimonadaceae bacterium]